MGNYLHCALYPFQHLDSEASFSKDSDARLAPQSEQGTDERIQNLDESGGVAAKFQQNSNCVMVVIRRCQMQRGIAIRL
jgi:hypothetical protein